MPSVPLESLMFLIGGFAIIANEKGLRYVAAAYLIWTGLQGLAPAIKQSLGV